MQRTSVNAVQAYCTLLHRRPFAHNRTTVRELFLTATVAMYLPRSIHVCMDIPALTISKDHSWMSVSHPPTPSVRVSMDDTDTMSIQGLSMDGSQPPTPSVRVSVDDTVTLSIQGLSMDVGQPPTPPIRVSVDDMYSYPVHPGIISMDGSQPPTLLSEYPWMTQVPCSSRNYIH